MKYSIRHRERIGRPRRSDDICGELGIEAVDIRCNARRELITRKRARYKRVGDRSESISKVEPSTM